MCKTTLLKKIHYGHDSKFTDTMKDRVLSLNNLNREARLKTSRVC